nr:hypothetical protein CFP56_04332 [Quercus suber]
MQHVRIHIFAPKWAPDLRVSAEAAAWPSLNSRHPVPNGPGKFQAPSHPLLFQSHSWACFLLPRAPPPFGRAGIRSGTFGNVLSARSKRPMCLRGRRRDHEFLPTGPTYVSALPSMPTSASNALAVGIQPSTLSMDIPR